MLTHSGWAGDTWLLSDTSAKADVMLSELQSAAARETGLLIRGDTCTVMDMSPDALWPEPEVAGPTGESHTRWRGPIGGSAAGYWERRSR